MSEKRRDVKGLLLRSKIDIVCIQESKLIDPSGQVLKSIGGNLLSDWSWLNADGSGGSLMIGWNGQLFSMVRDWKGILSPLLSYLNLMTRVITSVIQ